MHNRRDLTAQIVLAVFAGFAVFGLSFFVAWRTLRNQSDVSQEQYYTRLLLRRISEKIDAHKQQNGALPTSLQGFGEYKVEEQNGQIMEWSGKTIQEEQGQLLDSWNQPFEYFIQGDSYVLTSFGRDGEPGGIGLDCDLTNLQPKPPQSQLTLSQFASLPTAHYIRDPSLVIGLLVTVVLLVTSVQSTKQGAKIRLREFMVATLFIILFAGVFSGFISLEEIPSH